MGDVNLDGQVGGRVGQQVNLGPTPHRLGVLDVEARVWLEALRQVGALEGRGPQALNVQT